MFKKVFAIIALIGLAFTANVSTASAHSNDYRSHNHKYGGHQKFRVGVWSGIPIHRIRRKLRNRGFYKIRFTDRYLPVYKARACKHGKRFKVRINRWGRIMRRRQIGWCGYNNRHNRYNY